MRFSLHNLPVKDDALIIDYVVEAIQQAQELEGSGVGQGFEVDYLDTVSKLTGSPLYLYSVMVLERINKLLGL